MAAGSVISAFNAMEIDGNSLRSAKSYNSKHISGPVQKTGTACYPLFFLRLLSG